MSLSNHITLRRHLRSHHRCCRHKLIHWIHWIRAIHLILHAHLILHGHISHLYGLARTLVILRLRLIHHRILRISHRVQVINYRYLTAFKGHHTISHSWTSCFCRNSINQNLKYLSRVRHRPASAPITMMDTMMMVVVMMTKVASDVSTRAKTMTMT